MVQTPVFGTITIALAVKLPVKDMIGKEENRLALGVFVPPATVMEVMPWVALATVLVRVVVCACSLPSATRILSLVASTALVAVLTPVITVPSTSLKKVERRSIA